MWLKKLSPIWSTVFWGLLMLFLAGTQIGSAYKSYQITVRDGLKGLDDRGDAFTRTLEACMRAQHERGTLSDEWLREVSEYLIVAWGEPRAVLIENRNGATVAGAGDLSLLANRKDGRATIGEDELFIHSSNVRLDKAENEHPTQASTPNAAKRSFRVRVVLSASDAYFAEEFAWDAVIEVAIPWIGFAIMAMVAQYYSERLRALQQMPAGNLRRSSF